MAVYIIYFVVLLLGCGIRNIEKSRSFLLLILGFLWLIIGCRDISFGADTQSYVIDFGQVGRLPWHNLVASFEEKSELLFYLLTWLIYQVSDDYVVYLLLFALFPIAALYTIFKSELNKSIDYVVAILVFFMLGLFAFFVAGIRQTTAMSFVLVASKYIMRASHYKSRDNYIGILLLLTAYFFHNSSIIFAPFLLLKNIKIKWWYVFIFGGVIGLFISLNIGDLLQLSTLVFSDRFAIYEVRQETLNINTFIMPLLMFSICLVPLKQLLKKDQTNNFYFLCSLIGLLFASLSAELAEMVRISYYFAMFNMLLVPRALNEIMLKYKTPIVYLLFIGLCLVYLFALSSSNMTAYKSSLF